MRLLSEATPAAIPMHDDPELQKLLQDITKTEKFKYVIETGTFDGLGSTTFIAESFPKHFSPQMFVTIEADWKRWRQAMRNLRRFPFIKCLWGNSVKQKQAIDFIRNDDFILNHEKYDDIFIDNVDNPVEFYTKEVLGELKNKGFKNPISYFFDRKNKYQGEGLMEKYLRKVKANNPLVILDSAGGIGFLEFSILIEVMGDYPYVVLLDDVKHIKHYRSVKLIEKDPDFQVLGFNKNRWLVAKHVSAHPTKRMARDLALKS